MAFQVSPGVNVSEIDLTTVVPAVATTTGAIAGHFRWGPVDQRVTISSEDVLVDNFQSPNSNTANDFFTAKNFLAYGNQLQTVRVVNKSAAGEADRATNAVMPPSADAANTTLQVRNEDEYIETFNGGQANVGNFYAKYPGELGNSLKVSICPSSNAFESTVSANLLFQADSTTVLTVGANTATGDDTADWTAIDISSNIAAGDRIVFAAASATIGGGTTSTAVSVDAKVASVNSTAITLTSAPTTIQLGVTNTTALLVASSATRKWEFFDSFSGAPGTSDYANTASGTADQIHIAIVDEDGEWSGTADTVLERFDKVSLASDAKSPSGDNIYYRDVVNNQSRYIWWNSHTGIASNGGNKASGTTFTGAPLPVSGSLVSGKDGATPRNADYLDGYNLFKDKADVDISLLLGAAADTTRAVHLINEIAESRKDCIVCLSPERGDVVNNSTYAGKEAEDVITFRNTLPSSSFAVLDSGWKYQYDKYNDVFRYVPLNGDVAGLMVRTDENRDPWFSPAGFNRGNVKNVVKLAYNPKKADRDLLYQAGVNPVVSFPGQGTVLFGDKTLLANPSAFDRINVRRLFIVLEKAIEQAAQSSLFEFNDEFTRLQFRNIVEPFLRDVQGRRGITDFQVVCDTTNNTPEVIDRNEFVGDIFIKPNRSINFIQLNFVAVRTGVEFSEVVGSV